MVAEHKPALHASRDAESSKRGSFNDKEKGPPEDTGGKGLEICCVGKSQGQGADDELAMKGGKKECDRGSKARGKNKKGQGKRVGRTAPSLKGRGREVATGHKISRKCRTPLFPCSDLKMG